MVKDKPCELCDGRASVYCPSDSAYLCSACDAEVHQANFLVARHVRARICLRCKDFDGNRFSGLDFRPPRFACRSCSPSASDDLDSISSSSHSSACVSTTDRRSKKRSGPKANCASSASSEIDFSESSTRKVRSRVSSARIAVDAKVEGVLVNWSRRLGVDGDFSVSVAVDVFGIGACLGRLPVLPFRVILAASFWLSLRLCGDPHAPSPTRQNLRRVEDITGVAAKLILAAESKLAPLLNLKRKQLPLSPPDPELEEGWAETDCPM